MGLGSPYQGRHFYSMVSNVSLTSFYFGKAQEIFRMYGLTAQACGRYLELYFQEYLHLIGEFVVGGSKHLGMECLSVAGNVTGVEHFRQTHKREYRLSNSLSERFKYAFPKMCEMDIGDSAVVQEKTKMTKSWARFGSRAAFLELYLNRGVEYAKLAAFREFFLFLVSHVIQDIPRTERNRVICIDKNGWLDLQKVHGRFPTAVSCPVMQRTA
ncbi:hypothetical protein EDC94DRAFT_632201 [Helicostylum pulchrum]|nr:hypothetical protein EDC94DRAFT_632201 [Helicostylum pulchrum]